MDEKAIKKEKILVVDDEQDILKIVSTVLRYEGYEVITATNGTKALQQIKLEAPELILLDYMLPDINGLELLKKIKKHFYNIPVIMLTGRGSEKIAVKLIKTGAEDYIPKPFDNRDLINIVNETFENKKVKSTKIYKELETINKELIKSKNKIEAIFKSIVDGVLTIDKDFKVTYFSKSAEDITGFKADEVIGKTCKKIFKYRACQPESCPLISTKTDGVTCNKETTILTKHRKKIPIIKTVTALKDEEGKIIGTIETLKDVSKFKELSRKHLEKEKKLAIAEQKLKYQEKITIKNRELKIKMEELKKKMAEISSLYKIGKIITSKLNLEDLLKSIMEMANKIFSADAYSIRLLDEKKNRLILKAHYGLSDQYLKKGDIKYGESIAGKVAKEKKTFSLVDIKESTNMKYVNLAIKERIRSLSCVPLILKNRVIGVITIYHRSIYHYTKEETKLLSTFATQIAIAIDNARLYEEKSKLAITDGLTGLFNHKHFQERLKEELTRAKRYHHPLSLIMVDIDYFKNYNDYYGHIQGDAVLKMMAQIFKNTVRELDIVARYGGEEFVIILPETDKLKSLNFAERLRQNVELHQFKGEKTQPQKKLTISLGIATYSEDADTDKLIDKADQALYNAKKSGRNKVCSH